MKRRAIWIGLGIIATANPTSAQLAVVDAPAIVSETVHSAQSLGQAVLSYGQQIATLNELVAHGLVIRNTLAAIAHGNLAAITLLAPDLNSAGLGNPFGGETGDLMNALGGLAGQAGQTAVLAQQVMQTNMYYLPTAQDFAATALMSGANAVAAQQALAQRSLQAADTRLQQLMALRANLDGTTGDTAAAGQATARLTGETALGVQQTNQLLAANQMTAAQGALTQARLAQKARADAEVMLASTQANANALGVGQFARSSSAASTTLASTDPSSWAADPFSSTNTTAAADASVIAADTSPAMTTMLSQPWGSDAVSIAQTEGLNPAALAATCVIESNCQNVAGTGTITGAFQMLPSTQTAAMNAAVAANPSLASYTGTAGQAVAAGQELINNATQLQGVGIADPTLLQTRAIYQFGSGAGPAVALASDNVTMASVLPQYSAKQLAGNGISPATTVGSWRASTAAKLGSAAYQPVLAS